MKRAKEIEDERPSNKLPGGEHTGLERALSEGLKREPGILARAGIDLGDAPKAAALMESAVSAATGKKKDEVKIRAPYGTTKWVEAQAKPKIQ